MSAMSDTDKTGHPWLKIKDEGAERREIADTLKTILDVLLRIESLVRSAMTEKQR